MVTPGDQWFFFSFNFVFERVFKPRLFTGFKEKYVLKRRRLHGPGSAPLRTQNSILEISNLGRLEISKRKFPEISKGVQHQVSHQKALIHAVQRFAPLLERMPLRYLQEITKGFC